MPPKPKFSKEEIVNNALLLVSEKGVQKLTARDLAERLGSSPRPIFTIFNNMDEVLKEVYDSAMELFGIYANQIVEGIPNFKQIGISMINFAIKEPKLYQLLFMSEHENEKSFNDVLSHLGPVADLSIKTIMADYNMTYDKSYELFKHLWIYTFGIGALCATKSCVFSNDEIIDMLGKEFRAMIMLIMKE
ncbi:MAG: TetR/AcrR family transcriptional regulator [Acholeplasmatales bacterium]|nr:TetR/AcrR family transcriptional regulator [Acholeplasmatales bacterium]